MVAMGAKELLEIIIRSGQLWEPITVKKAWPVTPRDLVEVGESRRQRPSGGPVPGQGAQEATEASLDRRASELCLVGEHVRDALDPLIGDPHVRPQRGSGCQAPLEERLELRERLGQRPFLSRRSRLCAMAVRRSWSLRPDATNGGRPSSVKALRTALQ